MSRESANFLRTPCESTNVYMVLRHKTHLFAALIVTEYTDFARNQARRAGDPRESIETDSRAFLVKAESTDLRR